MSARLLSSGARGLVASSAMRPAATRSFTTTIARLAEASPLPARKPVGAFRGGLFGFLLGTTAAGAGVYTWATTEYKASNAEILEDIYALQNACQRLSQYVQSLEEKMDAAEKKSK